MEQVAQMQRMMTQQQMSMESFMAKFPQAAHPHPNPTPNPAPNANPNPNPIPNANSNPAPNPNPNPNPSPNLQASDEPERRLVLLRKRLMELPQSDFARIDDLCRNLIESGALGPNCRAVMFNVIGEDQLRFLALCLALEDGTVITSADLPAAVVENRGARKASICQYVAASGEFKCVRADGVSKDDCFFMDIMAKGIITNEDPELNDVIKSLSEAAPSSEQNPDPQPLTPTPSPYP